MIVNDTASGKWQLVRQVDHAAAASVIAAAWDRPTWAPQPAWGRFVDAVRRHDDGWRVADRAPRLDADGRPLSFSQYPVADHAAIWRTSVDQAAADDPFAGLLIALHARRLQVRYGERDAATLDAGQRLIDDLTATADRLLDEAGRDPAVAEVVTPAPLEKLVRLLGFFDGLSLQLIGGIGWIPRYDGLAYGDEEADIKVAATGDRVLLAPWPMWSPHATVTVAALRLPPSRLQDPIHLVSRAARSVQVELSWELRPGAA